MTDYVIIEPDGELTLGDGYPAEVVGCHGSHGQMLQRTRTGIGPSVSVLRMLECNCSFDKGHEPNPIARAMLSALGYGHPVAGRVAIHRIDWAGDPDPLTLKDVQHLRNLAAAARAAREYAVPKDRGEEGSG